MATSCDYDIYYLLSVFSGGGSNILRKGVRAMQGVYDIKDKVPETGDIGRKGVTPSPPPHLNTTINKYQNTKTNCFLHK